MLCTCLVVWRGGFTAALGHPGSLRRETGMLRGGLFYGVVSLLGVLLIVRFVDTLTRCLSLIGCVGGEGVGRQWKCTWVRGGGGGDKGRKGNVVSY